MSDLTTVTALMTKATKSVLGMRDDVQAALEAMIAHTAEHNDASLIITKGKAWIEGLSGTNKKALVDYMVKFGGVVVAGKDFKNVKSKDVDLVGAQQQKWWLLADPSPFVGFSLDVAIQGVLKKAENAMIEGDQSKVFIDPVAVAALLALKNSSKVFTDNAKEEQKRQALTVEPKSEEQAPEAALDPILA